ncbi:thiolase family protein [Aminobacter aminovorans]|uniref:thiolase family protein n=1 Tax=Aminobacter aminovorans TaxID=83263 RepID=UPI0028645D7C|nr:thiolase family protein [Aminobacter aminovorans]MDR7223332.1 acetyl-CoA acetyltransferase [Aminobacter aminovorans]
MQFDRVFIPMGAYWTSPFCRWQGALSGEHPLSLLAAAGSEVLAQSAHPIDSLEGLHLGTTVPSHKCFWGAPWVAALMGNDRMTGPTLSQACATSARVLASGAAAIQTGAASRLLAAAADRTSNGPLVVYPNPANPGGATQCENWVLDNFQNDPYASLAMVDTAENIARRFGFSREAQDDVTLLRYNQYLDALASDRAFQRRYMRPVVVRQGKAHIEVTQDSGIAETSAEALARLRPVREGGTVTFGGQTHPADGHAAIVLASEPSTNGRVQLLSYGEGRVEKGHMGMAAVPAARAALAHAGKTIADMKVIKTHNPFVVNDLYFAAEMGVGIEGMNNFGSSLIFGHPQGPTGMRLVIEMIEELLLSGGGYGLFTGCAAGDTGAAIVLRVE